MGRALVCPLCRKNEVSVEEVRYTQDIWSSVPLLSVEVMLALVCRNCRHVQIVHPSPVKLHERRVSRN
jgi:hypothetical protein